MGGVGHAVAAANGLVDQRAQRAGPRRILAVPAEVVRADLGRPHADSGVEVARTNTSGQLTELTRVARLRHVAAGRIPRAVSRPPENLQVRPADVLKVALAVVVGVA